MANYNGAFTGSAIDQAIRETQTVYNVTRYGAVGDGTSDNSTAIDTPIASNRTIVVPPASQPFVCAATMGGSSFQNVNFVVMPGATIKQDASLDGRLFFFTGDSINICGGGLIDVSDAPNSGGGAANDVFYMAPVNDSCVSGITISSGTDYPTAGGDSHIFMVGDRNKIMGVKSIAPYDCFAYISGPFPAASTYKDTEIAHCHVLNGNNGVGVKRLYDHVHVHHCTFTGGNNGCFTGEADTDSLPGINCEFSQNTFRGMGGRAIILRITSGGVANDNRIYDHVGDFIIALEGADECDVNGNKIINSTTNSNQVAILVTSRTFNAVTYYSTNNRIEDNKIKGVYTGCKEDSTSHSNNRFLENRITGETVRYLVQGSKSYYSDARTRVFQGIASGYSGTEIFEEQIGWQTTGAGTTNRYSVAVSTNRELTLWVDVVGHTGGVSVLAFTKKFVFKRASGGDVTLADTSVVGNFEDYTGAPDIIGFADTATQQGRVQCVAPASTTINWVMTTRRQLLATNA